MGEIRIAELFSIAYLSCLFLLTLSRWCLKQKTINLSLGKLGKKRINFNPFSSVFIDSATKGITLFHWNFAFVLFTPRHRLFSTSFVSGNFCFHWWSLLSRRKPPQSSSNSTVRNLILFYSLCSDAGGKVGDFFEGFFIFLPSSVSRSA